MAVNQGLNTRQKKFCRLYVKYGNGHRACVEAGYTDKNADVQASTLLRNPKVVAEIERITKPKEGKQIADAEEVMDFYTRAMRGEIKDQFNLDPTLADRLKAANELAKRTVDIQNRVDGKADSLVAIKFDWGDDI